VALPVESGLMLKGGFSETVEASKAAVIDYYGSYSGTGAAHEALSAYGMDHGLQFSVPVVEEYITDPNTEPDTTKWHTRVIYRIVK
jgi:effector-binding domain-containing protein